MLTFSKNRVFNSSRRRMVQEEAAKLSCSSPLNLTDLPPGSTVEYSCDTSFFISGDVSDIDSTSFRQQCIDALMLIFPRAAAIEIARIAAASVKIDFSIQAANKEEAELTATTITSTPVNVIQDTWLNGVLKTGQVLEEPPTATIVETIVPPPPLTPYTQLSTCGSSGVSGPTQGQCDTAYVGLSQPVVTVTSGYQVFTLPETGSYQITATGANGGRVGAGTPGKGASAVSAFSLPSGTKLVAVVGQAGETGDGACDDGGGGGGGGTFVGVLFDDTTSGEKSFGAGSPLSGKSVTLLVAAGGGAGNDDNGWGGDLSTCEQAVPQVQDAKTMTAGGQPELPACGGAGAGFSGGNANGGNTKTFLNGATANTGNSWMMAGGFGGGASSCNAGGGGGGYWGSTGTEGTGGNCGFPVPTGSNVACAAGGTSWVNTGSYSGAQVSVQGGGNSDADGMGSVSIAKQ